MGHVVLLVIWTTAAALLCQDAAQAGEYIALVVLPNVMPSDEYLQWNEQASSSHV